MPPKQSPATNESAAIIDLLNLVPHPEGGWYREVFRSDEIIPLSSLPERYTSPHSFSTSIYFLLEKGDFSAFHRISSDETWHFYMGSPLIIYSIQADGSIEQVILGNILAAGHILQYTIPSNCWFAAKIQGDSDFSLVGCTVAPGFEFQDFELGQRQILTDLYPQHADPIAEFTRI